MVPLLTILHPVVVIVLRAGVKAHQFSLVRKPTEGDARSTWRLSTNLELAILSLLDLRLLGPASIFAGRDAVEGPTLEDWEVTVGVILATVVGQAILTSRDHHQELLELLGVEAEGDY